METVQATADSPDDAPAQPAGDQDKADRLRAKQAEYQRQYRQRKRKETLQTPDEPSTRVSPDSPTPAAMTGKRGKSDARKQAENVIGDLAGAHEIIATLTIDDFALTDAEHEELVEAWAQFFENRPLPAWVERYTGWGRPVGKTVKVERAKFAALNAAPDKGPLTRPMPAFRRPQEQRPPQRPPAANGAGPTNLEPKIDPATGQTVWIPKTQQP